MDWEGLPIIAELIGVVDVELLAVQLLIIRDFANREH